jgi:predicted transcriptional regulator
VRLAGALAALGSVHRLAILVKLLEGPGTYRTLQKATGLKAGPLYHHIGELRLAGLIGPRERDLYNLTRGGRNLVLLALTLPKLMRDRRPRPEPSADGAVQGSKGRG